MKVIPISKPIIGEEEIEKVIGVLKSGMLASGEYVKEFERKFADYTGVKNGIATSSGTTALHTVLEAFGIGEGDLVLTTPFSFIATANSILCAGAQPVFADVNRKTFNIDPHEIERRLEGNIIKALLIVHLYGCPCDMERIMKLVREHDLILIEDCAQAHGAEYRGKKVGSFGDAACFSFYPTKNLTTGEGGMILTNDDDIADKARKIIDHGRSKGYRHEHDILGYNYRMTDIAAAIGIEQLKKLDGFNEKRIRNAEFLTDGLEGMEFLELPSVPNGCKHVFHQFTVRVHHRDRFISYLSDKGIGYGIYYPIPIHRQRLYTELGYNQQLIHAERAAQEVISLPIHPSLSEDDLERILRTIQSYNITTRRRN